jgi:hypothetical protein
MASSFFNSNNCSGSVLAKNWQLCTQLAASACKVCMQLAATWLQDKRQADKRCLKGHLYIKINIF